MIRRLTEPWTASQRGVLIGLVGLLLAYATFVYFRNPTYVADPMPATPPGAAELEDRIDPNTADWATLAALPNIGEKRARDIVAYRDQAQRERPGEIVFHSSDALTRVRGIGPAIASQIAPYLRFPDAPATAPPAAQNPSP
jgi:DNA uptake protein ComE-like DNA-binding protein